MESGDEGTDIVEVVGSDGMGVVVTIGLCRVGVCSGKSKAGCQADC